MTLYRKSAPYRKPQTYRGAETAVPIAAPTFVRDGGLGWSRGTGSSRSMSANWIGSHHHLAHVAAPWGDSVGHYNGKLDAPFKALDAFDTVNTTPWDRIASHGAATSLRNHDPDPFNTDVSVPWSDIDCQHAQLTSVPSHDSTPHNRAAAVPWSKLAAHGLACSALWRAIVARGGYVALPWGPIAARSAGINVDWPVEPNPQPGVITLPSLPVYVMLPTLSCVRLPDRTPLPLLSISTQLEEGAYAWTFSAPVARSALALLNAPGGAPTEIEVTINGYVWTFIVDGYDDNRKFGSNTATLRGGSRNKYLGEPYASTRTYTETADRNLSQLADAELPVGWTLVWEAPDVLVPGGTFTYQDMAPIDAIAQLANAIGATLQPDRETNTLTVAPTYPESPWTWDAATPYAILPAGVLTDGGSSWQGGTNANGIYVYAQDSGSGAFVKIAGTDGATQLPMIVDRLTMHADAQRERGRNALAAAGVKRTVTRTIPLFPTPAPAGQPDFGPVPIGKLLEIEDGFLNETWRGQVVAVRIDATRGGSALSVRQHLTIERQYR